MAVHGRVKVFERVVNLLDSCCDINSAQSSTVLTNYVALVTSTRTCTAVKIRAVNFFGSKDDRKWKFDISTNLSNTLNLGINIRNSENKITIKNIFEIE